MFASLLPNSSADIATVDVAVITLIGTVIGYFIRALIDRHKAFSSANGSIKRKMYLKFVEKIVDIGSKDLKTLTQDEAALVYAAYAKHAKEFYTTSLLFASPKVVRVYADFARHAAKPVSSENSYELLAKLSRLYKAMRKDIGLSNGFLGMDGELLLRANINDYDTTVAKYVFFPKRFMRWLKAVLGL